VQIKLENILERYLNNTGMKYHLGMWMIQNV